MWSVTNLKIASLLSLCVSHVTSLDATDTITWGGDNSRTGYQTNHNMDPNIVGSSGFGQIFKTQLGGTYNGAAEQMFSQPLVYTLSDGIQYVFVATTQNNIYKLNAATGVIVAKRNMHIPFLVADLDGCTDINPLVGVTSTGVIDPGTDTWYLTAKTYENQTAGPIAQGRPNGRYYFHAINVNDLSERPGFPVNIEGVVARNNALRSFNGGIQHQRPALLLVGQYVYAGFASHCVKFAYMGWIIGWDKTTGAVVESYGMEGSPVDGVTQGGGIWMSGGGLASDDAGSMFYATGNGHASQLSTVPVNGHNPPSALEEAAVHMTINTDGSLTVVDFFMPWEKVQLDGGDRDLGTSPLEILPSQFSCGGIKRIGVVTGKTGKTYWINLDDMGGYQNGPNQLDNVIQVTPNENSVYAGAGVYPLEGGYIYINVIKYPTHVFKFNCVNGVASFTKVADTNELCAYLGVGHGTTTSLNGQAGTGLLWVSDVNGFNLRVYNAVPVNGQMNLIKNFTISSVTKFTRPVFGNGRVYIGTTAGYIYGFGSTTKPSMTCTVPDFGTVSIETPAAPQTVNCTAAIAFKVTSIALKNTTDFSLSGLPAFPLTVAAGQTFSFKAAFSPTTVGAISADVAIATTNGVTGYSVSTLASLHGTGQSNAALLSVSPISLSFQEITGEQSGGVNQTILFTNSGNSLLTISSIQFSPTSSTGPFSTSTNFATLQVGVFTFYNVPKTIAANGVSTVTVNFDTSKTGNFSSYLVVNSNGGNMASSVNGISGAAPVALVEFQTIDGLGWVQFRSGMNFTFGNVTENQTRSLKLRVTNNAPVDSADLSLQVSKPPFGVGIISANNLVDLNEGTLLGPGESATATLYCSVPKVQWNTDSYIGEAKWTMNVNDPTFGHQDIPFICNAVAEQAPPLLANGNGQYRYVGCFKENNPGRQLKTQIYGNDNNTIAMCVAACAAGKYAFCGTQYNRECWGGPTIPNLQVDDANCDFPCKGDINQICGGNGVGNKGAGAYISLFADSLQVGDNITTPVTPVGGPFVNPGVGGYTSIGCYTESTTGRALSNGKTIALKTVANCVSACSSFSYIYAGLEYGGECWCGNSFTSGSVPTAITDCSTPCADNATEYCGAGQRLNVYQFNGAATSSSSISTSGSSSASTTSLISTVSTLSSISSSLSSTSTTSTTLISTISTLSSTPSSLSSTSLTSTTLISTSSSLSTSKSLSSTPTVTSISSTSTPTGPSIVPSAGGYTYLACYAEPATGRALPKLYGNDLLTVEICATQCAAYKYFGVEYGRECWCGDTINPAATVVPDSDCSKLCGGSAFEYCGNGVRLNIYAKDSTTPGNSAGVSSSSSTDTSTLSVSSVKTSSTVNTLVPAVSTPSTISLTSTTSTLPSSSTIPSATSASSALPPVYTGPPVTSKGDANFTYYSCVSEPSSGRLLSKVVENNGTAMTIEKCLSNCYMYAYAGVEYGRECWCGNALNLVGNPGAVPGGNVSDSQCSFTCPGNASEFCGSGGRMNLYWLDKGKANLKRELGDWWEEMSE